MDQILKKKKCLHCIQKLNELRKKNMPFGAAADIYMAKK